MRNMCCHRRRCGTCTPSSGRCATCSKASSPMACATARSSGPTPSSPPSLSSGCARGSIAGVFGALIERVVIRRISTATVLNPVIVTVGLSLILLGAAGWIWGYEIRTFPDPVVGPPFHLGTVVVSQLNALIFLVTLVLMTILFAFFRFSPTGIAMRAVAENRMAAQLMGISIGRMNALGWGMGTAMGAVTGMLIAPINYLDPSMMGDVALKAFAAAVGGGLTSLPGAVVGGLLLGIVDSVVGFEVPELRNTIAFALIVLVLVVRPGGLLGRHETKKV